MWISDVNLKMHLRIILYINRLLPRHCVYPKIVLFDTSIHWFISNCRDKVVLPPPFWGMENFEDEEEEEAEEGQNSVRGYQHHIRRSFGNPRFFLIKPFVFLHKIIYRRFLVQSFNGLRKNHFKQFAKTFVNMYN